MAEEDQRWAGYHPSKAHVIADELWAFYTLTTLRKKKNWLKSLLSLDMMARLLVNAKTQQKNSSRYLKESGDVWCNASLGGVLLGKLSLLLLSAAAFWQHSVVLPSEAHSGLLGRILTYWPIAQNKNAASHNQLLLKGKVLQTLERNSLATDQKIYLRNTFSGRPCCLPMPYGESCLHKIQLNVYENRLG